MSPLTTGLIITAMGVLFAATLSTSIASWLSTKRKLAELDVEVVKLRQRMDQQDKTCGERLQWVRDMDVKLNQVVANTERIKGIVEEMHHKK